MRSALASVSSSMSSMLNAAVRVSGALPSAHDTPPNLLNIQQNARRAPACASNGLRGMRDTPPSVSNASSGAHNATLNTSNDLSSMRSTPPNELSAPSTARDAAAGPPTALSSSPSASSALSNASNALPNARAAMSNGSAGNGKRGGRERGATEYDEDAALALLKSMKEAGYGDKSAQKKALKEAFQEAVAIAKGKNGADRNAKAWQKFNRMKQEHSQFIKLISESGRDEDDPDLHNEPPYFQEMRALEKGKARHDPPAVIAAEEAPSSAAAGGEGESEQLTSSRKRRKLTTAASLEAMEQQAAEQHKELAALVKKQNEHIEASNHERALMREVVSKLVDKF